MWLLSLVLSITAEKSLSASVLEQPSGNHRLLLNHELDTALLD